MITFLSKLHDASVLPYLGWAQAIAHTGPECALIYATFYGLSPFVTSKIQIFPSEEHVANLFP